LLEQQRSLTKRYEYSNCGSSRGSTALKARPQGREIPKFIIFSELKFWSVDNCRVCCACYKKLLPSSKERSISLDNLVPYFEEKEKGIALQKATETLVPFEKKIGQERRNIRLPKKKKTFTIS